MSGLLLWDFDGTLAYHTELWSGCLARILSELGSAGAITSDDVAPHLSAGFPWHSPEVAHPHLGDPDLWWAALYPVFQRAATSLGLHPEHAQRAAERMREEYPAPHRFCLFSDVLPALDTLHAAGWRHVLLSNHTPELPRIVTALGLDSHLDGLIGSAATGFEKPHPAMFEQGRRYARPGEPAWMIGDNYSADIEGAERCGIPAILVRKDHPVAQRQAPDLANLHTLLGKNQT